ncbi:MAG: DegT/DnrJ/EryC1/StrS family aminotransferase [candidate division WOR-3 bacterium]
MKNNKRIYLSPPHMSGEELEFVKEAFASNWVAPLGPMVDAFEKEFAQTIGVPYACALSSGTAALHLALRIVLGRAVGHRSSVIGQARSAEVICPTLTFAASANVIVYEGCRPVFIDCSPDTWTLDPELLEEELEGCARKGKLPRAVITVDLYGQPCDYGRILKVCERYDVPVIEDAAEALGARYEGRPESGDGRPVGPGFAGSFGVAGAFSFNGNKVITTAGGGMLVSHNKEVVDKARFLSTQARDPAPYYQHSAIGFNYRLSNILAAIGRGQLKVLFERVAKRRWIFDYYQRALGDLPGVRFMPEASYGKSSRWLTCMTIERPKTGDRGPKTDRGPSGLVMGIIEALERENIEARPIWKPLHLQPVFKGCRVRGGRVAEGLFENGLCLPSGSILTEDDLERICAVVRKQVLGF